MLQMNASWHYLFFCQMLASVQIFPPTVSFLFAKQTLRKITDLSLCVCDCVCPSQAIPQKLLKSSSSNLAASDMDMLHNASHIKYIDLDLHSRSHRYINI